MMNDYDKGYDDGKKFAQNKVLELMNEVIEEYEELIATYPDEEIQAQVNAVKFMKNWVLSGGHEDENGNRVCLVW